MVHVVFQCPTRHQYLLLDIAIFWLVHWLELVSFKDLRIQSLCFKGRKTALYMVLPLGIEALVKNASAGLTSLERTWTERCAVVSCPNPEVKFASQRTIENNITTIWWSLADLSLDPLGSQIRGITNKFDCATKAVVFHTILWYGIVFGDLNHMRYLIEVYWGTCLVVLPHWSAQSSWCGSPWGHSNLLSLTTECILCAICSCICSGLFPIITFVVGVDFWLFLTKKQEAEGYIFIMNFRWGSLEALKISLVSWVLLA